MQATEENIDGFAQIICWLPRRINRAAMLKKIEQLHGEDYAEKVRARVIELFNKGGSANGTQHKQKGTTDDQRAPD